MDACQAGRQLVPIYDGLSYDPAGPRTRDLPLGQPDAQLYDAVMVVVSQKLGRKCTVPTEPGTFGVRIHYAICSPPLLKSVLSIKTCLKE